MVELSRSRDHDIATPRFVPYCRTMTPLAEQQADTSVRFREIAIFRTGNDGVLDEICGHAMSEFNGRASPETGSTRIILPVSDN
jgi:hypothetical protein